MGGQNVVWVVRGSHRGPVLIRGRQLDDSHDVRFERGQIPVRERRIQKARHRGYPRAYSSVARIASPGCYAFQVDGLGFSRVIVFEVKANGPANADEVVGALKARGLAMQPSLIELLQPGGTRVGSAIFCLVDPQSDQPCSYVDVAPAHWYRTGSALALYLGTNRAMLETMETVLGEQFAGA